MEKTMNFEGCRVQLLGAEKARTSVWLPVGGMDTAALAEMLPEGVQMVAVDRTNWNRDFSPWAAPAVFRDGDFLGGGPAFLRLLTDEVIPTVEAHTGQPAHRVIAGYSLAGLFAVWAIMNTDLFDAVAGMSGSLWFDGFIDYARGRLNNSRAKVLYLSVGDRESRTRNPRMARVEECTREMAAMAADAGMCTRFELNPGNHFADVPQRVAKGIRWVLEHL